MLEDEDGQMETQYVSHFAFPLDFQFLAKADKVDQSVSTRSEYWLETVPAAAGELGGRLGTSPHRGVWIYPVADGTRISQVRS